MKKKYVRDLMDHNAKQETILELRKQPCFTSSIGRKQPLTILESLLKLWPPHDLRYNNSDLPGYTSTDSELMKDLVKGLEMKILRRDIYAGTLELSVEIQDNLAEYERYNLVVQDHNRRWYDQGCPENVFDPVHGDILDIPDKYIDPATITSSYYPQPDSVYSYSTGPLARARPEMHRSSYILVRYRLIVEGKQWRLGYVVYDPADRVIYYNETKGFDLAYLVRRSVQEIWGNSREFGKSGRYLEGIPMLIQGKKLPICKRDNQIPTGIPIQVLKETNPALTRAISKQVELKALDTVVRYVLPIVLILGMFKHSIDCGYKAFGIEDGVQRDVTGIYVVGMLLIVGALVLLRLAAQYTMRKVSEIEVTKKLL